MSVCEALNPLHVPCPMTIWHAVYFLDLRAGFHPKQDCRQDRYMDGLVGTPSIAYGPLLRKKNLILSCLLGPKIHPFYDGILPTRSRARIGEIPPRNSRLQIRPQQISAPRTPRPQNRPQSGPPHLRTTPSAPSALTRPHHLLKSKPKPRKKPGTKKRTDAEPSARRRAAPDRLPSFLPPEARRPDRRSAAEEGGAACLPAWFLPSAAASRGSRRRRRRRMGEDDGRQ